MVECSSMYSFTIQNMLFNLQNAFFVQNLFCVKFVEKNVRCRRAETPLLMFMRTHVCYKLIVILDEFISKTSCQRFTDGIPEFSEEHH